MTDYISTIEHTLGAHIPEEKEALTTITADNAMKLDFLQWKGMIDLVTINDM